MGEIAGCLVISLLTSNSDTFHQIDLGKNDSITIKVKNKLPLKLEYAIYLRLEFIDEQIKIYPHFLETQKNGFYLSDVNLEEDAKQNLAIGALSGGIPH